MYNLSDFSTFFVPGPTNGLGPGLNMFSPLGLSGKPSICNCPTVTHHKCFFATWLSPTSAQGLDQKVWEVVCLHVLNLPRGCPPPGSTSYKRKGWVWFTYLVQTMYLWIDTCSPIAWPRDSNRHGDITSWHKHVSGKGLYLEIIS
jgi:hypothetical protein